MVKRKQAFGHICNSKYKVRRIDSAFSLPEIDKILEERLSGDAIFRGKTNYPSNVAMLGDDSNKVEDPINKLPIELRYLISSLLTMREAAAMGILSRGYRYLWRTYGKLDFDLRTMTGVFEEQEMSVLQDKMCIFVRWVNQILKHHCGPKIESFRIAYRLGEEHHSNIYEWIQFAVSKGVQKLNICLSSNIYKENRKPYNFPHWLFTKAKHENLKHLSLDLCSMDIPSSFVSFRSLTSLTLSKGTVTKETVENILSNCLCLEWLSITACHSPVRLQFGGGGMPLKLRHLNIAVCNGLKEIEIYDAVHIASFEYLGGKLNRLLFKNGAQLKRLCFNVVDSLAGVSDALGCMASNFPKLETLMLSTIPCLQEVMIPHQLPLFSKLRRLVLRIIYFPPNAVLNTVSTLLKVSPLMHKLELHFPTCIFKSVVREIPPEKQCDRHENLKVVEMYNFNGVRDQVEAALYLFNSCVALKKMKVDCCWRRYRGDGKWEIGPKSSLFKQKDGYQLLRKKVPPSVKLVVL